MDTITRGPPVSLLSDRLPWESPQYIGPQPHNLPAPMLRPGMREFQPVGGIAPSALPAGPATAVDDKFRYVRYSGEQIIAVPTASVLALVEPPQKRNILTMRNSSAAANIYISFGTAASLNSLIRLAPNVMIQWDTGVPQDEVYAFADAAAGQLTLGVGNYTPGM